MDHDHDHGMDHDMDMGNGTGHHMAMYMYFTKEKNFYVLFEGWMVMDTAALGWSCFGLFLMAMFLEFIRAGRMEIERNAIANSVTPDLKSNEPTKEIASMKTMVTSSYLLSSFLYMFQMTLSYF